MAWNNQGGGGPWGGGGGGQGGGPSPWSRGPGGQPPDFEEMLRRGQDRMKSLMPGGMGPGRVGGILVGVAAVLWLASGLYQVQPGELGVPLIFGKYTGEQTPDGLHWNWPAPIGSVLTPNVNERNTVEIGFRGGAAGSTSSAGGSSIEEESLILTGDENIVQVEAVVQWHIDDAEKYLFEIRDPNESLSPDAIKNDTVKNAVEAAIREIIGQNNFGYVYTEGRETIGSQAQGLAQRILDSYNSGIAIDNLSLQRVDAPQEVIDAFRDVQKARADKESSVNEAQGYFNRVTQEASGRAIQMVREAEAYRTEKVANAQGDAQRFISVYDEYKQNPDVTSRRLYLETLESIMSGMDKVLIDTSGQSGGAVPYLPLDQLLRDRKGTQPVDPTAPTQPSAEAPASGTAATGGN
jgi:membrane protease subunit HflK